MTGQEQIFHNLTEENNGTVRIEFNSNPHKGVSVLKIRTDKKTYFKRVVIE
jgi:hypothetical protein